MRQALVRIRHPLHASLIVEQFTLTCELVSIKQRSGQRTKTSALTPSLPTKRALPRRVITNQHGQRITPDQAHAFGMVLTNAEWH